MDKVKYRLNDPRLAPRRTRLEIPGWAGKREPRADGSREQVWHCVPFSEGAQYGIELFYPYDNELRVSTKDGHLILDGDWGPAPDGGVQWPPFRNFGDHFYTYQILLDIKVEKGMAIRTEPHPRFYTDRTDTVPIAVPALVRNWWPMMFFCVFKAPAEGRSHIFRPNEPFAQIIVIPEEAPFELEQMSEEEAAEFGSDAVAVMVTCETDADQVHQDFADCSKTKPLPPSQLAVYDMRNPANRIVLEAAEKCPIFREKIDATSKTLGKHSTLLFLANHVRRFIVFGG